ncbi:reverse transcriptase zinc-binding domain-containing protein [Artemisia annua]|uniref:Reverse transcriptase zinc-binding domain-containing protein n=1 Tax=Artemisia annua TaxID=35608 RepID=A0A2U1KGD6_ARTAN|nr:reverse transcriptase zinc-binding domain-containing protein [Artemisia annua]
MGPKVGGFRCLNGAEWASLRADTWAQKGEGFGAEIAAKRGDDVQSGEHKSQVLHHLGPFSDSRIGHHNLNIVRAMKSLGCTVLHRGKQTMSKGNSVWNVFGKLVFAATVYHIWQERNLRIFNHGPRSVDKLVCNIYEAVRLKLMSLSIKHSRNSVKALAMWKIPKLDKQTE